MRETIEVQVTEEQAQRIEKRLRERNELADVYLENHGLYAEHNMPCAVCLERKAVFDCQELEFHPCGQCQRAGRYLGDRDDDKAGLFGSAMFVIGVVVGLTIAALMGA